MEKFELIKSLDEIEKYHRIQYKKLKSMLSGVETTNPTPMDSKDCSFGIWLEENEQILKKTIGDQFLTELINKHDTRHDYYKEFFSYLYKIEKKGFFAKERLIFNSILDP